MLVGFVLRVGLVRGEERYIAIRFAESEREHSIARILCQHIEAEGDTAEWRKTL